MSGTSSGASRRNSDVGIIAYSFLTGVVFDLVRYLLPMAADHFGPAPSSIPWAFLIPNAVAALLVGMSSRTIPIRFTVYPVAAGIFGVVGYANFIFVSAGIITVVWHGVIGAICGLTMMARDFIGQTERSAQEYRGHESVVEQLREDVWSVVRLGGQFFVAFATVTGIAMTILFRGGYDEPTKILNAVQMVTGFGFCSGALYFWIAVPGLRLMERLRQDVYRSLTSESEPDLGATRQRRFPLL